MVLVPLRNAFKELQYRNLSIKEENLVILQNYLYSQENDQSRKNERYVPVGIHDTIKDKLGILKINFFMDSNGKVFLEENNQKGSNTIEFSNIDEVAGYIDYITKLGIYCKLYDNQFSIVRTNGQSEKMFISYQYKDFAEKGENFESFAMQQKDTIMQRKTTMFPNNTFLLNNGEKNITPLTLAELSEAIVRKFQDMSYEDIVKSEISQHEFRKIIGMQYQDINLTSKEINALKVYKEGAVFKAINGFLRGDLDSIEDVGGRRVDKEKFVMDDLDKIVDYITQIAQVQKKFLTSRDMTLIRRDSRINEDMESKLEYDNFVSTSANQRLFTYRLDSIKPGGFLFVKVPKGTPVIPVDIIKEKEMTLNRGAKINGGGDIEYEESEMLMPMCDITIDEKVQAYGNTFAYGTMTKQKDPIEITEARLKEMSDLIVQYGGKEKLQKLMDKVQAIKSKDSKKQLFSERKEENINDVRASAIEATKPITRLGTMETSFNNIKKIRQDLSKEQNLKENEPDKG